MEHYIFYFFVYPIVNIYIITMSLKDKEEKPNHKMSIPKKMLADIERMFKDPTESNMEAFIEFKTTLIEEEMYMMLKQLRDLEIYYNIDIPLPE